MGREIQLDGAETSVIKALVSAGNEIDGGKLIDLCEDLEIAELIDTLHGLLQMGYVDADSTAFYGAKEMADIGFRVNSGYSKALKDALDDKPEKKSKRVRRE